MVKAFDRESYQNGTHGFESYSSRVLFFVDCIIMVSAFYLTVKCSNIMIQSTKNSKQSLAEL